MRRFPIKPPKYVSNITLGINTKVYNINEFIDNFNVQV